MNDTINGAIRVPAGKTLADIPKKDKLPVPDGKPKPRNVKITLRDMIVKDETRHYLVALLKELGTKRAKGPWREYLEFYQNNQSGDIDSMKPEHQKYCKKLVCDLEDEYFKQQDL